MLDIKIIKIIVDKLPKNCAECNVLCHTPCSKKDNTKILRKYFKKRHEQCLLQASDDESEGNKWEK